MLCHKKYRARDPCWHIYVVLKTSNCFNFSSIFSPIKYNSTISSPRHLWSDEQQSRDSLQLDNKDTVFSLTPNWSMSCWASPPHSHSWERREYTQVNHASRWEQESISFSALISQDVAKWFKTIALSLASSRACWRSDWWKSNLGVCVCQ